MDNIELNENQLQQLRQFIIKRGINNTDVIDEILDHFACKAEEILSLNSTASFEKAMVLAHKSFGISGFHPIVAQYEKHLGKTARKTFFSSVKEIALSPAILFSLAGSYLYYAIISNIAPILKTHWLFGIPFWTIIVTSLSFLITKALLNHKINKHFSINIFKSHKADLWLKKTFSVHASTLTILNFSLIALPSPGKTVSHYLLVYCSIIVFLSTINSLAQYKTFIKMNQLFRQSPRLS